MSTRAADPDEALVITIPRGRKDPRGDALPERTRRRYSPWASFTVLKTTMAATGTVMALFVLVHMVGNLKAFLGPESYNHYAAWLRDLGYPLVPHEGVLWILRAVLGLCLIAHVTAGLTLWRRARRARGPVGRRSMRRRTVAARSMVYTGCLMLVFVAVHLLDLTIGRIVAPEGFIAPVHDGGELSVHAYENLVASLSRPPMAAFYSLVMLTLGLHLAQGIWTVVHDLGGTGRRLRLVVLVIALAAALAVVLGNGLLPVLVLAGVIS